ncbi:MAG: hypothetical protein ABJG42_06635 [Vibrio splendidus]
MEIRERFDFYMQQYDLELARKSEVSGVVQIRLLSFISASGVMLYMLKSFQLEHEYMLLPIVFFISSAFSCLTFLYIAWFLYKAYWGDTYERLPPPSELEQYYKDMVSAEILDGNPDAYLEFLIEEVGECVDNNMLKNDRRYQAMNKVMKRLPIAIVPFVLAGGIYLFADLDSSSPRKPITIEIIDSYGK